MWIKPKYRLQVLLATLGCLSLIAGLVLTAQAKPIPIEKANVDVENVVNAPLSAVPDLSGPWEPLFGVDWSARSKHTSVVLPDDSILLLGGYEGSNYLNDVWRSNDQGDTWTLVTDSAEWSGRSGHTSVVLPDGSIILMGGRLEGNERVNDVWRSTNDGATWSLVTDNAEWSPRASHTSVVLPEDGSILVMGGGNYLNDVWRSEDGGRTWSEQTPDADWRGRVDHTSVALSDSSILVIAGKIWGTTSLGGGYQLTAADVWKSQDQGVSWIKQASLPKAVGGHTSVVVGDDGIVVMGGHFYSPVVPVQSYYRDYVFRSDDQGESWMELTDDPGWSGRSGHSSVAVADDKIVLLGGYDGKEQLNDVWYSTNQGGNWREETAAEWPPRRIHTSVTLLDGSIVVMGGLGNDDTYNDVWCSTDQGKSWIQMTGEAEWSARSGHTSVVLPDGSIVLMGGSGSGSYFNDVWRSTDKGATWTEMTGHAGWLGREGHTSVVLPDGSIVLMGGRGEEGLGDEFNDVWFSTNQGSNWTEIGAAGWPARAEHTSVVLPDGSIVLMGGSYMDQIMRRLNDVWRSTDQGKTWTEMTEQAEWLNRDSHASSVLPDGSIVLMGGFGKNPTYKNDVWLSRDNGATWEEVAEHAEWSERSGHTSVVLPGGSIVLMGGFKYPNTMNDVWRLKTGPEVFMNYLPIMMRE